MSRVEKLDIVNSETTDQVREALGRVLSADEFERSERLTTFLKYLVEKTLCGETEHLKGYALGIDVFNKSEDFNPDTDAIVRVHAVRLRAALDKYYLHEGADDPLKISLPKGGYVPVFGPRILPPYDAQTSEQHVATNANPSIGPKLAIMAVEDITDTGTPSDRSRGLTLQLVNDLTRFRSLTVISMQSVTGRQNESKSGEEIFGELKVDYILSVSLLNTGRLVVVSAQLLRPSDKHIFWSDMIEREFELKNLTRILQDISAQVTAKIGSPYGAIADAEIKYLAEHPATFSDANKCSVNFFDYTAQKTEEKHAGLLNCLEDAVKSWPQFARGWAMLAWIYGDEIRFGYNAKNSKNALERSENAARYAISLDPNDGFTHIQLAHSLILAGKKDRVHKYFKNGLNLNPNDTELMAHYALYMANEGEWDEAERFAEKAMGLNSKHPNWYRLVPYMAHFRKGDYQMVLNHVETNLPEKSPLTDLGWLAVRAKLGDLEDAKRLLARLDEEYPGYSDNIIAGFRLRYLPEDVAIMLNETISELRRS